MTTRSVRSIVFCSILLAACGGEGSSSSAPAAEASGGGGGKAKTARRKAKAGGESAGGSGKAGGAVDPLAGLSKRDICSDSALAMVRWEYDALQSNFQGLCCGGGGLPADDGLCSMDWPFNDVPACEAYDALRNGIYARYGYPFDNAKWRKEFEGQPWYHRREDFSEDWLSPPARHNVEKLKQLKEKKVGCSP